MEKNFDLLFMENWMSLLKEKIKNKKLINLKIPGSHDSNTHTVKKGFWSKKFARCQKINIYEQMKLGIRYLDLRYGSGEDEYENKLVDRHGPFTGELFYKNLDYIFEFLKKHPEEFLILNFQNENKLNDEEQKIIVNLVKEKIGEFLINEEDRQKWFKIDEVTLSEIWKTKKRIFCFFSSYIRENKIFTDKELKKMGIFDQNESIDSKWHDVNNPIKLMSANEKNLKNRKKIKNKFFCSQFVMTFQRDPEEIIKNLVSLTSPDTIKFVKKLYKNELLQKCITKNLKKNLNLVLFDHIDYDLNLLKLLLCSNFTSKLKLYHFSIGEHNFTEKMKNKLNDNKFVYFPNLENLYKKYKTKIKQILIIYKFNDSDIYKVKISKKNDNSFLVFDNPIFFENRDNKKSIILFYKEKIVFNRFFGKISFEKCFEESFKNGNVDKCIIVDGDEVQIKFK